jgi:hypothetical protein
MKLYGGIDLHSNNCVMVKLEKALATLSWQKAREAVEVKLLPQD